MSRMIVQFGESNSNPNYLISSPKKSDTFNVTKAAASNSAAIYKAK
jgi:hypothetical protein